MSFRFLKVFALSFPFVLLLNGSALANTCNSFGTYTCFKSTPNIVHVGGQAGTGGSVGTTSGLITGSSFTLSTSNGSSASDLIVAGAFLNSSPTGTLDGISFTSLTSFPEGSATNAIISTLQGLNLCSTTCNLSYGYVDLHTPLAANGTVTVTINGLPTGTALYGLAMNTIYTRKGGSMTGINFITPNSEGGVYQQVAAVPEPGTLTLMGTGLVGLIGGIRRKLKK